MARLLLCLLLSVAFAVVGCRRGPKEYKQDTPEHVIESLEAMVEDGNARRLHELFYAEDEDMRLALRRFGRMCGSLAELAKTIGEEFPEEVEELRKQTEEAAARGEATNILSRFSQSAFQNRRNRNQPRNNPGDAFNLAFRQLLSNPYASFENASERLSTVPVSDGFVGLMWDDKPLLPPFGIMMREDGGKWYIVLPLDLPIITKYRPRTEEQWTIAGYLMRAWENAAKDLKAKIEAGDLRNLDEVAQEAGVMLGPPTLMIMAAYSSQFKDDTD